MKKLTFMMIVALMFLFTAALTAATPATDCDLTTPMVVFDRGSPSEINQLNDFPAMTATTGGALGDVYGFYTVTPSTSASVTSTTNNFALTAAVTYNNSSGSTNVSTCGTKSFMRPYTTLEDDGDDHLGFGFLNPGAWPIGANGDWYSVKMNNISV